MILHTLGTAAGTQPIDGFHHVSTAIETEKGLYFIDTGECCAYTAHIKGLDLLKTKAVFLTHPHMDHVGGLGHLLWYIRKVSIVRKCELTEKDNIDIYTPCTETVYGFMSVLKNTEGDFSCRHSHTVHRYFDGVIYDNGDIRVTAVHTHHMPKKHGQYTSYAFRVECEGKTIVFSGDMRLSDLSAILPDKCDIFFVETGHHKPEDIKSGIDRCRKTVGKVMFTHNGGALLRDPAGAESLIKNLFGQSAHFCRDAESFEY